MLVAFSLCVLMSSCRQSAVAENGGAEHDAEAAENRKLLKVITDTSRTTDVLLSEDQAWISSFGGIRMIDRKTGEPLRTYTRHDGLAENAVGQLIKSGDDILAFHPTAEKYSVLKEGAEKWMPIPSDHGIDDQGGHATYANGTRNTFGSFRVRQNDIWCIYTESHIFRGESAPEVSELRQYSRDEFKLLQKIDLLSLARPSSEQNASAQLPKGLHVDDQYVWLVRKHDVVRIKVGEEPLACPVPDKIARQYADEQNTASGHIESTCFVDEDIWVKFPTGLAKFNTVNHQWGAVLDAVPNHASGRMISSGDNLWFNSGRRLIRYNISSKASTEFEFGVHPYLHLIHSDQEELWTSQGRYSFTTDQWDNPLQGRRFHPGRVLLMGDYALVYHQHIGLMVHHLSANISKTMDIGCMGVIEDKGKVWLIGQHDIHQFAPQTGKLLRHSGTSFGDLECRRMKLLKKDGSVYWYYLNADQQGAKNFYSEHFVSFDLESGTIAIRASVPEELRHENANPSIVSDQHLYINSGKGTYRYDLQNSKWEKAPDHLQVSNGYQSEVIYNQTGTWHLYKGELRKYEGGSYTTTYQLGPYMKLEQVAPEWLEITSKEQLLRFNGKQWSASPYKRPEIPNQTTTVRAVDHKGRAADRYAMIDHTELTIWNGLPKHEVSYEFESVEFPQSDLSIPN